MMWKCRYKIICLEIEGVNEMLYTLGHIFKINTLGQLLYCIGTINKYRNMIKLFKAYISYKQLFD